MAVRHVLRIYLSNETKQRNDPPKRHKRLKKPAQMGVALKAMERHGRLQGSTLQTVEKHNIRFLGIVKWLGFSSVTVTCDLLFVSQTNPIFCFVFCKHPSFWVRSFISTGAREFWFTQDGSKCWSLNTTCRSKTIMPRCLPF
jgi:hypothetical protein